MRSSRVLASLSLASLVLVACGAPASEAPPRSASVPPAVLVEMSCCDHPHACPPLPRPLDTTLVESEAEPVEGVRVAFGLQTGGDQLVGGCRGVQTGLAIVVQAGTRVRSQQLASCDDAGSGEPPEEASCDGRHFAYEIQADAVVVREGGAIVARIPL